MTKIKLKDTTLCAVSGIRIPETIHALKKSMRGIEYAEVILITHEDIDLSEYNIKVIKIEKLDYNAYSHFVLYRLKDYIKSDFVLLVQHDGYVLQPQKWTDEFFKYDYIGAPWPAGVHFTKNGENVRVGNGGFTLRSKKMLNIFSNLNLSFSDFNTGFYHEDGVICVYYRDTLIENGIKFAPVEVASLFSRERWCSDSRIFTFGFHSNRRNIFKFIYKKIMKKFYDNN